MKSAEKWYDYQAESVAEDKQYKILRDMTIKCDDFILIKKPDIVIIEKMNQAIIEDIASLWDPRVNEKGKRESEEESGDEEGNCFYEIDGICFDVKKSS
ncbi:Hypothetical predicted protein [Octopus vulgaris]|uniref:Uncharacterized protein n=1 Tax=Octopus vulgaris TaxID=6645 RepID=A0AA36C028_OCTVU|nr:Hypothetical predicted protein [Octopus vulgaris]